jgi:hypothetical protein
MAQRKKLSTTIGPESFTYLHRLVKAGKAASVGEAVDKTVEIARRLERRAKLERDTAAYFAQMTPDAAAEENALANALSDASMEVDFGQP